MKLISRLIIAFAALSLSVGSAAELKVATIDLQKLVNDFYKTDDAQKELSLVQTRIQTENKARLERIRKIQEELEGLKGQLQDGALAEAKMKELEEQYRDKNNEGIALDRERREYLERRTRSLNERMGRQMRVIVEEINKIVEDKARQGNYDFVFDKSARSGGGMQFLTYSKDSFDITAEILAELNKDAPATEEGDNAEPAPAAPEGE